MNKTKKITPLTKFPTEALVMNYRRHRVCRTRMPWLSYRSYNKLTCNYDYWIPVSGPLEVDGIIYNPCIVSYKRVTRDELEREFTEIKGDLMDYDYGYDWMSFTDEMEFTFEGMYWRGTIDEIKAEMAKRPHVPLKGRKQFRRWKMNYKKTLKVKNCKKHK